MSRNKTKTSILNRKSNTNSIDSNNANRIIIPNKTTKNVSLKSTHANHANINSMITSNEPTGKLSRHTGEYYIYCSPVNASDTDEIAARKIQQFCDYVRMLGIFKISDAELINGLTSKQGVLLSFHVSNNDEYDMMFNQDSVLQKLANDYDDGSGLTVIRKRRNPIANGYYIDIPDSSNKIRQIISKYGYNDYIRILNIIT